MKRNKSKRPCNEERKERGPSPKRNKRWTSQEIKKGKDRGRRIFNLQHRCKSGTPAAPASSGPASRQANQQRSSSPKSTGSLPLDENSREKGKEK